jgi:hypothetical protein
VTGNKIVNAINRWGNNPLIKNYFVWIIHQVAQQIVLNVIWYDRYIVHRNLL